MIDLWGKYAMKQLAQLKEGKLKTFVDKGDNSPTGPFVGLDKVVDAVDVRGFFVFICKSFWSTSGVLSRECVSIERVFFQSDMTSV